MGSFRMGAAFLALEHGVPVVPGRAPRHVRRDAARPGLAGPGSPPADDPLRRAAGPGAGGGPRDFAPRISRRRGRAARRGPADLVGGPASGPPRAPRPTRPAPTSRSGAGRGADRVAAAGSRPGRARAPPGAADRPIRGRPLRTTGARGQTSPGAGLRCDPVPGDPGLRAWIRGDRGHRARVVGRRGLGDDHVTRRPRSLLAHFSEVQVPGYRRLRARGVRPPSSASPPGRTATTSSPPRSGPRVADGPGCRQPDPGPPRLSQRGLSVSSTMPAAD